MWDDVIEEDNPPVEQPAEETPAEAASAEEAKPEEAEPPAPESNLVIGEPRKLVFRHWSR